jgi:hypothetical protein
MLALAPSFVAKFLARVHRLSGATTRNLTSTLFDHFSCFRPGGNLASNCLVGPRFHKVFDGLTPFYPVSPAEAGAGTNCHHAHHDVVYVLQRIEAARLLWGWLVCIDSLVGAGAPFP